MFSSDGTHLNSGTQRAWVANDQKAEMTVLILSSLPKPFRSAVSPGWLSTYANQQDGNARTCMQNATSCALYFKKIYVSAAMAKSAQQCGRDRSVPIRHMIPYPDDEAPPVPELKSLLEGRVGDVGVTRLPYSFSQLEECVGVDNSDDALLHEGHEAGREVVEHVKHALQCSPEASIKAHIAVS